MESGNKINGRAIVLVDNNERLSYLKSILKKNKIIIEEHFDNLYLLDEIKKTISKTGNTVNIRKEFVRFLQGSGIPKLIVMDYRLNLGLGNILDPDERKLFRTFLITYLIISGSKEYDQMRGNFFLFVTDKDIH